MEEKREGQGSEPSASTWGPAPETGRSKMWPGGRGPTQPEPNRNPSSLSCDPLQPKEQRTEKKQSEGEIGESVSGSEEGLRGVGSI